ncbi:MAG TPA: methyltransferase domain-containing protein, partial [Solirubrobacteraceae bacterium]|nr:methyltransferase domain-containing protein [Solirubrobacteraceae bacterium]
MIDDVACCPDCRGQLVELTCSGCGRSFSIEDGVVRLLPLALAHMAVPAGAAPGPSAPADEHVRWVEDEMAWWDPRYATDSPRPFSPNSGLRGRSRERNLLRPVRSRLPARPLVIEMGAGTSLTAAGLLGPARYVATDVSASALRVGRAVLPDDAVSVQCDAVGWPFREGVADVVMILGVLHHLSDWRAALDRACRTVRPGGFLLLHEAVTKPRVLGRWRSRGVDDDWVSPHEGDVPRSELLAFLHDRGVVERVHGEESPLRFALVRYL